MRNLVKSCLIPCFCVLSAGCAVQPEGPESTDPNVESAPQAVGSSCRWRIKFTNYRVAACNGETSCETWVKVSAGSGSVTHPSFGAYQTVTTGDTESVGSTIDTVTSTSSSHWHGITLKGSETDFLATTVTVITSVDLPCDQHDFTQQFTVESDNSVVVAGGTPADTFKYVVTLAFDKQ